SHHTAERVQPSSEGKNFARRQHKEGYSATGRINELSTESGQVRDDVNHLLSIFICHTRPRGQAVALLEELFGHPTVHHWVLGEHWLEGHGLPHRPRLDVAASRARRRSSRVVPKASGSTWMQVSQKAERQPG